MSATLRALGEGTHAVPYYAEPGLADPRSFVETGG